MALLHGAHEVSAALGVLPGMCKSCAQGRLLSKSAGMCFRNENQTFSDKQANKTKEKNSQPNKQTRTMLKTRNPAHTPRPKPPPRKGCRISGRLVRPILVSSRTHIPCKSEGDTPEGESKTTVLQEQWITPQRGKWSTILLQGPAITSQRASRRHNCCKSKEPVR